jgi:hypothetical protein
MDDNINEDEMNRFDLNSGSDASQFELNYFNETSLIVTLIINVICILFNVACLIFSFKLNKTKNLKYQLIFQYFVFKLISELITFKVCLSTLLIKSNEEKNNNKLINKLILKAEYFFIDFSDSNGNFMLFLIWLIFMKERNMISGFNLTFTNGILNKCLNLVKNQYALLTMFYASNFVYSIYNSIEKGGERLCGIFHNFSTNKNDFHLIPFSFWIFSFASLFWSYFGGRLDVCFHNLTENELNYIKFIKLTSILEFIEVVLNHLQILFTIVVHNSVLEMCLKEMTVLIIEKLIASVCTLATLCLFFTFDDKYHNNYVIAIFQNLKNNSNKTTNNDTDNSNNNNQSIYNNNNSSNNDYTVMVNEEEEE